MYNFSNLITLQSSVSGAYTPTHETNIRAATVLAATYDPISRPAATTEVKVGLSIFAIDSLVCIVHLLIFDLENNYDNTVTKSSVLRC